MSRLSLRFPVTSIALEAPAEVAREIERLYPWSVEAELATAPAAGDPLRVTAAGGLYHLDGPGVRSRRFREPLDVALSLALEIERAVLAARGERPAIHAGAVAVGGSAWLVAGEPESGKTTTVFQLIESGCGFLCEEVAIVDSDDRVLPFPQPLELAEAFLREVRARFPIRGELGPGPRGHKRYLPPWRAERALPIGALLLPRYRPARPAALERRTPADALTELLGHCFEPLGDDEAFFERVMALAGRGPIWQLSYPDAYTARSLLQELLAEVR